MEITINIWWIVGTLIYLYTGFALFVLIVRYCLMNASRDLENYKKLNPILLLFCHTFDIIFWLPLVLYLIINKIKDRLEARKFRKMQEETINEEVTRIKAASSES